MMIYLNYSRAKKLDRQISQQKILFYNNDNKIIKSKGAKEKTTHATFYKNYLNK